jgi:tRNA 2-(methylsulfanyl)-N6-isopentenyladenosine37 hydroxylase
MTGLVRAAADAPAHSPLLAATPAAWLEDACVHWRELLIDHANCEKKAASTALALIFAYPEERALALALSKLAREELRHFEQVTRLMVALGVPFARQRPGRYAQQLRAAMRAAEPGRKLDLLLVSALIEARSAERFVLLAPRLPAPIAQLYHALGACEARHFELYLDFARRCAPHEWRERLAVPRRLRGTTDQRAGARPAVSLRAAAAQSLTAGRRSQHRC